MPLRVDIKAPSDPRALRALLRGLTSLDAFIIGFRRERGRPMPRIYESGVSYERERGTEKWQRADEVLKEGSGDCEDLATWRAGELHDAGEVGAFVDVVPAASRRGYHAIVRRADGTTEDPSRVLLGQRPEGSKMAKRNTVIDVREDGSWYVGEVEVPTADGDSVTARAEGNTGADALTSAADLAERVMNDPAVAPFVPPQARAAVAGARVLANAAKSGFLSSLFGRLTGTNKRKLAEVLLRTTNRQDHRGIGLSMGATGRRRPGATVIKSGATGPKAGFRWNPNPPPGHWERDVPPPADPYGNPYGADPYGSPYGPSPYGQPYPSDPYAQPPYYGGYAPNPYGQGYGGYPSMDPYGGYGPWAPVDPWQQYQSYGWGPQASPWGDLDMMATQYGSQALDALWPQLRAQQGY